MKKSFFIEEGEGDEEETDGAYDSGESDEDLFDHFGPARSSPPPVEKEEEQVDGAVAL